MLEAVFSVALEPLDDEHDANGQHLPMAEYLVEACEGLGGEHLTEITDGAWDAGGTEDNPTHHGEHESQGHLTQLFQRGQHTAGSNDIGVFAVLAQQDERQEEAGMVESPGEESPVGAMPEAADEEDDKGVAHHLPLADTTAAQRDVDVVTEPGGQRDMPAAPELGNVAAEIGVGEVAAQADSEELGGTDGDIAVACEVAVNLESEEDSGHHMLATATSVREYVVHV